MKNENICEELSSITENLLIFIGRSIFTNGSIANCILCQLEPIKLVMNVCVYTDSICVTPNKVAVKYFVFLLLFSSSTSFVFTFTSSYT